MYVHRVKCSPAASSKVIDDVNVIMHGEPVCPAHSKSVAYTRCSKKLPTFCHLGRRPKTLFCPRTDTNKFGE